MGWLQPSERVRELMRQGAARIVNSSAESFDKFFGSTSAAGYRDVIAEDPMLVEAIHHHDRAMMLHWAAANVEHPAEPVPINLGAETRDLIRKLLEQGVDESAFVDQQRICQNQAVQNWMRIALKLTTDPDELCELQNVGIRSITSTVDANAAAIHRQMQAERAVLARRTEAARRQLVGMILDGVPGAGGRAENELGYDLEQSHTAAVIWCEESRPDSTHLDGAAKALVQIADGRRSLSVPAGAAARWVWLPGAVNLDLARLTTTVRRLPEVRVAIGSTGAGIEGFRSSHREALITQRTLVRLGSTQQVAGFADIELVALITTDPEWATRFIEHTLGDFESADAELQRTVLTFVREGCNASRAATRLFTHRNTLLNRLARADRMLPRPLEQNSLYVAVALEALSWRGPLC